MFTLLFFFFFFSSRRRHTRYIGDWSSDVCSSDLASTRVGPLRVLAPPSPPAVSHQALPFRARQAAQSATQLLERVRAQRLTLAARSEERRVGKECRSRRSTYHEKKKYRRHSDNAR